MNFIDLINDFVFVFDPQAKIIQVNKAFVDVLGYSMEELINKSVSFIHPPNKEEKITKKIIKRILTGNLDSYDIPLLAKNGDLIPVSTNIIETKSSLSNIFIAISQNLSYQKIAEEELVREKIITEMALNAQRDTFFVFDPFTGKAIRWNKAFKDISGYEDLEISQLKAPDSYYDDNDLKILSKAKQVVLKGGTAINEVHLVKKNGERVPFEYVASGIFDNDKQLKYIVAIGRDLIERKKKERQLEELQSRFRTIAEQSLIGICIVQDNRIKFFNQKMADELEYSYEEIMEWSLDDLMARVHPQDKDFMREQALKKQRGDLDVTNEYEYRLVTKSGKMKWVKNLSKTIYHEGRLADLVFQVYITERKKMEEDLRKSELQYKEAYKRANFYKDIFAHDMNNILHGILTTVEFYSDFLDEQEKIKKGMELFDMVRNTAKRGTELISNIQKLSKVENSEIFLKKVEICAFLQEAIQFINNKEQDKKINIKNESNCNQFYVQANELLLDVFENVLSNAVIYNTSEIVEINIEIAEIRENNQDFLVIEISDNGIGIPDSRKPKIFEVGNKDYKGGRGMGIGLSLVKKAIESYGGFIYVKDKVEGDYSKGSRFILKIPKSNN
ncbi:MAG: PAS domain-containing sensor histidine kinase [Candidatus Lokiarchaeota archaeon]|nr:PAS domain-containing sensor histidine kinase [Candidatus Lokiarchaeota archaeon]